jgi:hypothetical protein
VRAADAGRWALHEFCAVKGNDIMKYSRVALLFTLFLSSWVATSAQSEKGEWKRPKHSGKITSDYDQTNDQTKLSLRLMPVTCVRDGCIFISLESSFPGAKLKAPAERVTFGLAIVTKTLQPFTDPKLVFRLDGELMDVGEMTFAGKVPADELTGLPYGVHLTGDELAKISNARKVELQLGNFQFALNENAINAIKDYNHQARTVQ